MPAPEPESDPLAAEAIKLLQNVWGACDPSGADSTLCEQEPNSRAHHATPVQVGRYEDLELIGAGGYGLVFSARDPMIGRRVALKIPRPEFAFQPEARARFLEETRLAGSLNHPGIVQVFEAGEQGGFWYLATELCDGPDLAEWLNSQSEPISVRAVANFILNVCQAIGAAHTQGIIHRDLKPGNIMLVRQQAPGSSEHGDGLPGGWIPKVTDFGLAKLLEGGSELTRSGAAAGTPQYMAPEQTRGKTVSPATDIWAIGVILYEMLVGFPPFRSEGTLETMRLIHDVEPVPPGRLRSGLPADLETICLKCLEKEPTHRYASTTDLVEDLRRYLTGRTILAKPAGSIKRTWRWCQRNRVVASLAVVLVFTLVAGTVISSYLATLWRGEAVLALQHANHANELRIASDAQSFDALLAEARATRRQGGSGQRVKSLAAIRKALAILQKGELPDQGARKREATNELLSSLMLPDLIVDQEIPCKNMGPKAYVSMDQRLTRYAYADSNGKIVVAKIDDPSSIPVLDFNPAAEKILYAKLSRTGKYLAGVCEGLRSQSGNDVPFIVWRYNGDKYMRAFRGNVRDHKLLSFLPDENCISAVDSSGQLVVHRLSDGDIVEQYHLEGENDTHPKIGVYAFHPTYPILMCACRSADLLKYEMTIYERSTGARMREIVMPLSIQQTMTRIECNSDGASFSTYFTNGQIKTWDLISGLKLGSWTPQSHGPVQAVADERGRFCVSISGDNVLNVHTLPSCVKIIAHSMGSMAPIHVDSHDVRVGCEYTGKSLRIWKVIPEHLFRTYSPSGSSVNIGSINRDGHYLVASKATSKLLEMWNLETGGRCSLMTVPNLSRQVRFSPDDSVVGVCDSANGFTDLVRITHDSGKFNPKYQLLKRFVDTDRYAHRVTINAAGTHIAVFYRYEVSVYTLDDLDKPVWSMQLNPMISEYPQIVLSDAGDYLAISYPKMSGTVVFAMSSSQPLGVLPVNPGSVAIFDPNSQWIITSNQGVKLWSLPYLLPMKFPERSAVNRPAQHGISPCSKWLALLDGGSSIVLQKIDDPSESYTIETHQKLNSVNWSSNGNWLHIQYGLGSFAAINLLECQRQVEAEGLGPVDIGGRCRRYC